jgi:mono/diheme cytochrome c family protein
VSAPVRLIIITATAVLCSVALSDAPTASASPAARPLAARTPAVTDSTRTTMDGVYTAAQAAKGSDVFAAYCRSCHSPTVHAGPPFRNKWYGRTLGELFGYMRREMPKNEPGSMSDDEYALALAYLLRINGMPTGSRPLVADSAALGRIRLDSSRAAPTSRNTLR